jgi:hypothetical protein
MPVVMLTNFAELRPNSEVALPEVAPSWMLLLHALVPTSPEGRFLKPINGALQIEEHE